MLVAWPFNEKECVYNLRLYMYIVTSGRQRAMLTKLVIFNELDRGDLLNFNQYSIIVKSFDHYFMSYIKAKWNLFYWKFTSILGLSFKMLLMYNIDR